VLPDVFFGIFEDGDEGGHGIGGGWPNLPEREGGMPADVFLGIFEGGDKGGHGIGGGRPNLPRGVRGVLPDV
jgi:hypothetical protein